MTETIKETAEVDEQLLGGSDGEPVGVNKYIDLSESDDQRLARATRWAREGLGGAPE